MLWSLAEKFTAALYFFFSMQLFGGLPHYAVDRVKNMLFMMMQMEQERIERLQPQDVYDEWIMCIAKGDKQALTQLYTATKAAVYGFALSMLRNTHDAQDVMQEVYIRIYAAAPEYVPRGNPKAWIFTVTRNLCLMKLRQGTKIIPIEPELLDPPDVRDEITQTVERVVLREALSQLSDTEMQIVVLHAIAGQKHQDIATLLDIPLATVRSKYRRALSKLKTILNQEKEDEPHVRETISK